MTEPLPGVPEERRRQTALRELVRFLPDVGKLLADLVRDERVPWHAKVVAVVGILYIFSPFDVLPDVVPKYGQLDDVLVATRGLRYLVRTAGYEVIRDLWRGTDEGFALLLVAAGVDS